MRRVLLGTTLVLLLPAAANANWFRSWFGPRVAYYYSPPTVAYYVPVAPVAPLVPCPPPLAPVVGVQVTPAPPPLAVPQPAPPSRPPEPPPAAAPSAPAPAPPPAPNPEVGERRYYDAYAAGRRGTGPASGDRVSVSFWNLSDRDVVLAVGGQRVALTRGRSTTVEVPRQFAWQVEGRPTLSEQVPAGESALEIVIRR